jgi:small subunit ribosomal protein S23
MGRLDLSAQRVHKYATQLLESKTLSSPPPWYNTIGEIPPSARLVRPVLQRPQKAGKKSSRLFSPVKVTYEEDRLRWEYFNDHPWELAKPRVILEDDGKDYQKWDWSHALCRPEEKDVGYEGVQAWETKQRSQARRPLNGESVVQRQVWLMRNGGLTEAAAYDKARKELYKTRHAREVESRIAKEEARAYGAFFGKGPLEVGMELEDQQYANWVEWAKKEQQALAQQASNAYTGDEAENAAAGTGQEELQEVSDQVPGSKAGQTALGGAAVHP